MTPYPGLSNGGQMTPDPGRLHLLNIPGGNQRSLHTAYPSACVAPSRQGTYRESSGSSPPLSRPGWASDERSGRVLAPASRGGFRGEAAG